MRILVLTPWFPDEHNPSHGLFIYHQARALAARHEVTVISSKIDYSSVHFFSFRTSETQHANVHEHLLLIKRSWPLYNQLNFFLITLWYTWKAGRKFRPDILHGHVGYPTAFLCWAASKLLGVPYVVTEHTRLENNFRSVFHTNLTLFGLRRASAVIAVSKFLAKEIGTGISRPVNVIPNVVDVLRFSSARPSNENLPQIGFLGGLSTPVKGLDILLQAAAQLKQPFVLHIGGTGSLINDYKNLARHLGIGDNCRFYGMIAPDQVQGFMTQLHFFVCSSRYETFGVAVVEAMASGLPVVVTRCGGPEEIVFEKTGILVEKENIEGLCLKIKWMIANRSKFDDGDLRDQASLFSGDRIVLLLEELYFSLLEKGRSG